MQKVVVFKKRNFWSSQLDLKLLNEQIAGWNQEGWVIQSMTPNSTLLGGVISYTLLLAKEE